MSAARDVELGARTGDRVRHSREFDAAEHDAVIPPLVVIGVLDVAQRRGIRSEHWLAGTGLTRDELELPHTRLSFRQTTHVLRPALAAMPCTPVGLLVGARDIVQSWGLLGFALRACRSSAEAVEVGLKWQQVAGSLVDFDVEVVDNEFTSTIVERIPEPDLFPFSARFRVAR